ERDARIEARKKEAAKKKDEAAKKKAKLATRISENRKDTNGQRVKMFEGKIMVEVINAVQAKLAQEEGFNAVVIFDNAASAAVPTNKNPVTSDPRVMRLLMDSVLIPVVVRVRAGHSIEAKIAKHIGVDAIDEVNYAMTTTMPFIEKKEENIPYMADNPRRRLKALVQAAEFYNKPDVMMKLSTGTNERLM
ncbi:hypothetical protein GGI21_002471, partial [Coemansia aciculifera]